MPDRSQPSSERGMQARRDAMLPDLLGELRSVRRRRKATQVASGVVAMIVLCGIVALSFLRPLPRKGSPIARNPTKASVVYVAIIPVDPSILERLVIRSPSLQLVRMISTDEAHSILESGGERYGIIEIQGRVEFQLVAKK